MKKNMKKGFTIVELVIVIAVIAILTAVLIPTFTSATEKAKVSAALQNARNEYSLYVAELPEDETEDDTFYIKSGDLWFEVVKGEINTTPIEAPTDKGSIDLSKQTVVKSFKKVDDVAAPATLDAYYATKGANDVLSDEVAANALETDTTYYYHAYLVENQNDDIAIYAKVTA